MIYVNSINVYPSSITLNKGEWYYGAYAVVCPTNSSHSCVEWESSDTNIAVVNASNGYIYAKSPGTTTIYAKSTDGSEKKDQLTITVIDNIQVTSILLNRTTVTLKEGESIEIGTIVSPANATNDTLSWSSSNSGVATVDNGVVTAKVKGAVVITASANDGSGVYATCVVTVTKPVESVRVYPQSMDLVVGKSTYLNAAACPSTASNRSISWRSSNDSVVSVDSNSGFITAKGIGTAQIYATAEDGSGFSDYCVVTVSEPIRVEKIIISSSQQSLKIGDSVLLKASVVPKNASHTNIKWISSNPSVVSVNQYTGRVTALKYGTAVIKAESRENSDVFETCYVESYDQYFEELEYTFKFSHEACILIRALYDKVDNLFNDSNDVKAWKCARLLGGLIYGKDDNLCGSKFKWETVAGYVFDGSEEQYFTNDLKYTKDEYKLLCSEIKRNHSDATTPDFAHMQIYLSSRLAYKVDKDGWLSDVAGLLVDEEISYLAGWLGDATIISNGKTSFGNDDYCADLDAENIYRYILSGKTYLEAINNYYVNLLGSKTRADIFLSYIDYDYVEDRVYYYLIDQYLMNYLNSATYVQDFYGVKCWSELLSDKQYHYDEIKSKYPDTHDFLMSLKNKKQDINDY